MWQSNNMDDNPSISIFKLLYNNSFKLSTNTFIMKKNDINSVKTSKVVT